MWNITNDEINTFSKFVHGKMQPMSDKAIGKLSAAITEAIKDDKDRTYSEYYSDI